MPPRKFWLVTWGAEDDDNPYGMGLGHQLWWPVYLKRNGARFWAAYLDRFGVPTTKAVYPSDESEAENEKRKKDALAAALSLRSEGAVALPEGFDVSLVESTSRGSGDFKDFLAYWDDAIAKIILSQTGTTQQGQYSGTAEVLNDVKSELVKADADLLCESFNDTVATWLTEWNFPGAKTPQVWRKVPNTRREEAQRAADKGAYEIGLELTDDAINRRYGEDWKRRAAAPVSVPSDSPAFAEPGRDEPDEIAEQLESVTNAAGTGMINMIRAELDAAIRAGEDFAAFSDRISRLYPVMDTAELAEALEGAVLAANLSGRASNG